jgi:hypothetical protein
VSSSTSSKQVRTSDAFAHTNVSPTHHASMPKLPTSKAGHAHAISHGRDLTVSSSPDQAASHDTRERTQEPRPPKETGLADLCASFEQACNSGNEVGPSQNVAHLIPTKITDSTKRTRPTRPPLQIPPTPSSLKSFPSPAKECTENAQVEPGWEYRPGPNGIISHEPRLYSSPARPTTPHKRLPISRHAKRVQTPTGKVLDVTHGANGQCSPINDGASAPEPVVDHSTNTNSFIRSSVLHSSPVHPLLLSRITVREDATTIESTPSKPSKATVPGLNSTPSSSENLPHQSPASSGDRSTKVTKLRRLFDHPPASTPFLPFMKRHTMPAKSGPTLPIMVSTMVAVTTHDASDGTISPTGSVIIASTTPGGARRKTAPAGPVANASRSTQTPPQRTRNKLRKTRRESPVKDKISLFENLSRSASSTATSSTSRRPKSYDARAFSKRKSMEAVQRRRRFPSWHSKRGSRTLQRLTLSGD